MASMKSWISPDLLNRDARALNFTLFLQQLSFLFAATILLLHQPLKPLQQVSLL